MEMLLTQTRPVNNTPAPDNNSKKKNNNNGNNTPVAPPPANEGHFDDSFN